MRKVNVTHLGERRGSKEGKGTAVLLKGRAAPRLPSSGCLSGGLTGGSQWNIHQLSRYVLSGPWSPLSVNELVNRAAPEASHGIACVFLLLFWAWN